MKPRDLARGLSFALLSFACSAAAQAQLTCSINVVHPVPNFQFSGYTVPVAVDGGVAVVGAFRSTASGVQAGAVHVFHRQGGQWVQTHVLTPSDGQDFDEFGCAVDVVEDDFIVVGARHGGPPGTGAAYVFSWQGGTWVETAKLLSNQPQAQLFGHTVAANAKWLAVGMEQLTGGSVSLFTRQTGGTWTHAGVFPQWEGGIEYYGCSVAVGTDRVVIGSRAPGRVYVFDLIGTWTLVGTLDPSFGFGSFARTLAADGNTIVVGAPFSDVAGFDSGLAYVFEEVGGSWSPTAVLGTDALPEDEFGRSVAIRGDVIAVGAPNADVNGLGSGTVSLYERVAGTWTKTARLISSMPSKGLGYGVAVGASEVFGTSATPVPTGASVHVFPGDVGNIDTHGSACSGSLGIAPQLVVEGCPNVGHSLTLTLDDAYGPSVALLFLGTTPAAVPAAGDCTLWVTPLVTMPPLPLLGFGPGSSSFSATFALPARVAGATLHMQAFVQDPGNAWGYSATHGVRVVFP